jgi:hypothetical protein
MYRSINASASERETFAASSRPWNLPNDQRSLTRLA